MILYTMMPQELIFPQEEFSTQTSKIVEINGVSLSVYQTMTGDYQIERILSTDPQHYLDNNFTPGQKVKF